MVKALRINKDGSKDNIEYTDADIINKFNNFIIEKGIGDIACFDMIDLQDGLKYMFMGWELGYNNFNRFEFDKCNPFGDVIIIAMVDDEVVDVDREFLDNYLSVTINLDDYLIEDELNIESDDTYEYNSWLEDDTHDYPD